MTALFYTRLVTLRAIALGLVVLLAIFLGSVAASAGKTRKSSLAPGPSYVEDGSGAKGSCIICNDVSKDGDCYACDNCFSGVCVGTFGSWCPYRFGCSCGFVPEGSSLEDVKPCESCHTSAVNAQGDRKKAKCHR